MFTPPKSNMEPENTSLQKEKHLPTTNFWISMLVSGVSSPPIFWDSVEFQRFKLDQK